MNILELGRGKELRIKDGYWHQYVLEFDLNNSPVPFVVSEVGITEEIFIKNVSWSEICSDRWANHLHQCGCEKMFRSGELDRIVLEEEWHNVSLSADNYAAKWITAEDTKPLDYDSNHGNWDYTHNIPGKIRVDLVAIQQERPTCSVSVPIMTAGGRSYYTRYMGRSELAKDYILIWQSGVVPVKIGCRWIHNKLQLELFKTKLLFEKE